MMTIHDMLAVVNIYHFELFREKICSPTLINIIDKLLEVGSLKIRSLSSSSSFISDLSDEGKTFRIISKKNKITKVCLEKMNEINDIYFLIRLYPRMNYLQMNCINNNIDLESFLQNILRIINNDYNQYLRSMIFHILTADNKMIEKLNQMINSNKLLVHYTIKRVLDHIDLQWK
ncbi:unnamed protein product [Rotaria sordida]|uniref:Uncharacterized protein n=2 Tax=Rotaria sordida TaxID=392033 RepID=A0A820HI53_9BILA|nr:unnamed protein product [Rotaria sordida]CAF4248758.1 unnamed protein product [Rotaria sordida]CAF4293272.1 unnamed protein product [Rotaria sordida]